MLFFFNDTATTEIYTLSLHDALPISLTKAKGLTLPSRTACAISVASLKVISSLSYPSALLDQQACPSNNFFLIFNHKAEQDAIKTSNQTDYCLSSGIIRACAQRKKD